MSARNDDHDASVEYEITNSIIQTHYLFNLFFFVIPALVASARAITSASMRSAVCEVEAAMTMATMTTKRMAARRQPRRSVKFWLRRRRPMALSSPSLSTASELSSRDMDVSRGPEGNVT